MLAHKFGNFLKFIKVTIFMSIIEIKTLTKTFGKIQAVRGSETQTIEANNLNTLKGTIGTLKFVK